MVEEILYDVFVEAPCATGDGDLLPHHQAKVLHPPAGQILLVLSPSVAPGLFQAEGEVEGPRVEGATPHFLNLKDFGVRVWALRFKPPRASTSRIKGGPGRQHAGAPPGGG